MADKIEKKIDIPAWGGAEKAKEYVPSKPKFSEDKKDNTIDIDRNKEYQQTEEKTMIDNKQEKNKLSSNIQETINQLNRPEAKKGIAQSYLTMENTIKNSRNEKWVAGLLGRIMNKILG